MWAAWLCAIWACGAPSSVMPLADETCPKLFGAPNENTGLDAALCVPEVVTDAGEVWVSPSYTSDDLAAWRGLRLTNPYAPLSADPYASPDTWTPDEGSLCAVVRDGDSYRLETLPDEAAVRDAGGVVTHGGACGVCSSLENLSAYVANPDLTEPVRACGLVGMRDGAEANVACLQELGFDLPCAQAWYYNTAHTRDACLDVCITSLNQPYHAPDGSLNACLTCDEVNSGDVFKAVAGRTRRNSGVPNAMCRPCAEVWRIEHRY
jgi:hypothetical protein